MKRDDTIVKPAALPKNIFLSLALPAFGPGFLRKSEDQTKAEEITP